MNPIATSALVLTLLLFTSFVALKISEVSVSSSDQIAQPTPPANKSIEEIKSSNPACSPIPTPVSENEKNNPLAEMTAEDELNASLGTFDWDCDGVCNIKDNCIFVYNPDQKDSNGDGKGDACDPKFVDPSFKDSRCDQDRGGIPDFRDNCPLVCNPDQKDVSKNGIGDVCDQGFPNAVLTLQVCAKPRKIEVPRPSPTPLNDACKGDPACDPFGTISARYLSLDSDGDGIPDFKDNCPLACNPDQKDMNKNGIGDLCDKAYPNAVLTLQVCSKPRKVKVPKSQKISTVKNN